MPGRSLGYNVQRYNGVRIGLKSGRGFYDYRKLDLPAYRKDVFARTLGALRHAGLFRPPR